MNIIESFQKVKPLIDVLRGTRGLAGKYTHKCHACGGTVTLVKSGHNRENSTAGAINGQCTGAWCIGWSE